jgi:2-polyprenyl-3-methyl-5-hydroxy-6-metoxy-1,4-benzoquinol methylase
MDSAELNEGSHALALRGLARINALSLTAGRIWRKVRALSRGRKAPLRILDVACGGGDVALALKRRAEREGIDVHVEGWDLHPFAVEFANRRSRKLGLDVGFFQHDATQCVFSEHFDLVCSSLFLHHLSNAESEDFLGRLDSAGTNVFVQDLLRTRLGYLMAVATTQVVTRSPVVHVDGPRSVRAAFTLQEVHEMTQGAGLTEARIERCWPERFSIAWEGS